MRSHKVSWAVTILLIAQATVGSKPFGSPGAGNWHTKTARGGDDINEYNFSVPVDHFHNDTQYEPHSNDFFPLRYFLKTSYYKPGGPVIVIASGEFSADFRAPYLDDGIGNLLAKATGGVVLALEHRYYGTSFPVSDLSLANYRFLTIEQAVADAAYFAQHVQFPGLEHLNLTSHTTPWIIYGGSYAGAFAAFTRKLYPDVYWGAISSSGVTEAVYDFWAYNEAARLFAPGNCGPVMSKLTHVVDTALFSGSGGKVSTVKQLFGYNSSVPNDQFGSSIAHPSGGLQGESWVEGESDTSLEIYCVSITANTLQYPDLEGNRSTAEQLVRDAGYAAGEATQLLNYVGAQRQNSISARSNKAQLYQRSTPVSDTNSWFYQTCTQWGYFISGSGVPQDILGILSRAVTVEFIASGCNDTFGITTPPNVDSINRLGGIEFSYPRVAIVDGKQDPWRTATPHKIGANANRKSTTEQPFVLIDPATHHWDEFDVPASEYKPGYPPKQIVDVHNQEVAFVKAWLAEFHKPTKYN
ncbi:hypothetical protein NQ176_g3655 [Zarea fungicola]|uniref:Uncharacterized protein n=1 Tax=Zarea fungicola TaxID=93591 RepID=A0ACC1NIN9_9HYPO|nr:hypothetical protein NQ176_g3655 [Lecanicillium fungicola]